MLKNRLLLLCVCILLSGSGFCLVFMSPLLFDCSLSLHYNPILYHLWKNVPFDLKAEFYIFNWTNPEDIHNISVKPKFEEMGPYVFHQKEEKCNIFWNDNVNKSRSKILELLHPQRSFSDSVFLFFNNPSNSYSERTTLRPIPRSCTENSQCYAHVLVPENTTVGQIRLDVSRVFSFHFHEEFSQKCQQRNGSAEFDGVYNMGTGSNTVLGKIDNWNYEANTGYFDGTCGRVSGTSGQFFQRNLTEEPREISSADLKRTIALKFLDVKPVNGILGHRYIAANYMMDNGTLNPKNKCFCPGDCNPSGLANISSTRHHSPIFASLPHFYGADPYYFNLVDGLKPDQKKHDTFFVLEPNTGTVLEANARIQLNLLMDPVPGTGFFDEVPKVYFPVLWIQQKVVIPSSILVVLKLVLALPVICITLGIILILSGFIVGFSVKHRRDTKRVPTDELETTGFLVKKNCK